MNRRLSLFTLFALASLCGLTSCTSIFMGIYGMRKPKVVDHASMSRYTKKFNIPYTDNYELDPEYFSYLFTQDTVRFKGQIKNRYQPLQALYYDRSGHLRSYHVNCYAGGFPNLKWNRGGIMTTFPPGQQAPLDSLFSLETHLAYLQPLPGATALLPDTCDYTVIVHWNMFMGRQSKRLIRTVQKNSKIETERKVRILYVNTDNLFTEQ